MSRAQTLRLSLMLLLAGLAAWGVWAILDTDPAARKPRPQAPLPLVEVLPSQPARHTLQADAHGTVSAADALNVRPQVGGRLLKLHANFEPGGHIPAGEVLFEIDPADYELAVKAAEAELASARAAVAIERGKRKVAAEELRLLEGSLDIDEASRQLALRAPQLAQVRAEVLRAQNALAQARLQLQRTAASLPHDVVVLSRSKVPGEVLGNGEAIGQVARADRFWVELQVPPGLIERLQPGGDAAGVSLLAEGHTYPAKLTRVRAALSDNSRLAGVIAEVEDPLGLLPQNQDRPPLLIGSYVEARIAAGSIDNAVALPRSALQDNGRVWIVDAQQRLQVREVQVLYMSDSQAYIAPLSNGDRVLARPPASLVPGTEVRVQARP